MKKNIYLALLLCLIPSLAQAEGYYFHYDHLGSVDVVTNEEGEVVAEYDYLPFGELYEERIYDEDFSNSYKFTDQEEDAETGLYYYGARYYGAEVGRFMAQDPAVYDERVFEMLQDPQSFNAYAYVRNNPVKFVDPSGEEAAVIFYGEDFSGNDSADAYKHKAEIRANEICEAYNDGVFVIDGSTFENWQDALETYTDIGLIEYYGHGDDEAIYLRSATLLNGGGRSAIETIFSDFHNGGLDYYDDGSRDHYVSDLFVGNLADSFEMHLWSCNASTNKATSVAQSFSNHFNAGVYAANTSVNFRNHTPYIRWYRKLFGHDFEWVYPSN